ncbi:MAG: DegT/DnrJ/EryC1/StrS family aminotransferase [Candidatus Marinimicrobia bacterium]|nr:DegT/DnrJ/EryC1/StrS family aminotransferase [Candidatus Neomarinimicrobiota bacterium]
MIVPHYRPSFDQNELRAVQTVIDSKYIAQGNRVRELETQIARYINKKYCIAVTSGTTALTMALKSLNVADGDEVIIPSYTCTALWHAVKAVNGTPVLSDIEPVFYNMDPEDVKRKITLKTKAIIFPHMFGQPGRIQEVLTFGIPVIEDIAQSIGASIDGKPVGSYGQLSIVSFYAGKIIGAGEGGAILTNEESRAANIQDIREYDQKDNLIPRINAKISDLTASVALEQFKKLPEFFNKRRSILNIYKKRLGQFLDLPVINSKLPFESNLFRCIATHPDKNAAEVIGIGKKTGITIRRPVYRPIHKYLNIDKLPETEQAWNRQFSIPLFPDMTKEEINFVFSFLKDIFINSYD